MKQTEEERENEEEKQRGEVRAVSGVERWQVSSRGEGGREG